MTQDNRLWILISRRLSGEISPDESEELHRLLEQSPDKQYLLNILHSYFSALPPAAAQPGVTDMDLDERLHRIMEGAASQHETRQPVTDQPAPVFPIRPIRLHWRKIIGFAAAVTAVLLLGRALFVLTRVDPTPSRSPGTEEILARAGARTKLVLPDGTQVWLNSNSKLRYSGEYNVASREVELEGEAYFDVVKNVQRPFIVHASPLDIKVLGTAFAVKSYPQEETIETTLIWGSIEVMRKDNPSPTRVILKPNEKLVFSRHLPALAEAAHPSGQTGKPAPPTLSDIAVNKIRQDVPDSDKVETAWMYNRLVFQGDSFKELAAKMERWYNIKIIFHDDRLGSYRFGGAFVNETVEEAFKALQFTADFSYTVKGNEIELYSKK